MSKEKIVFDMEIYADDRGFHWRADIHKENITEPLFTYCYINYVCSKLSMDIIHKIDKSGVDVN